MKKLIEKILVCIAIKLPILQIIVFFCLSMLIIHLSLTTTLQEYREYTMVLVQQIESKIVFVDFIENLNKYTDEFYRNGNRAFLYCNKKEYEVTLYYDITDNQQSKYYFLNSPDISLDIDKIKILNGDHNLFESIVNRLTGRNYEK
jgi:hypothetical protein